MKKGMVFLGLMAVLTACNKKEPRACFSVSGTAETGSALTFENCSEDAISYIWDFGDGSSSGEVSPTYAYFNPGTYTCTLTAYSGNRTLESEATQTIVVTDPAPATGEATVWTSDANGNVTVTLTGNGSTGSITQTFPGGVTVCNTAGCANFTLPPGTYNYEAIEGGTSNQVIGSFTVTAGNCTLKELTF